MSKNEIRNSLLEKLKAEHCFWSYTSDSWDKATNEQLIEKTLIYLDLPEIDQLLTLYGRKKVKQVWLHRLVSQGDYLHTLNRFLAWYYFQVKNPDTYLKAQETRYWKKDTRVSSSNVNNEHNENNAKHYYESSISNRREFGHRI